MAGTKEGGKKAAAKNLANNPNFYQEIGSLGGKNNKQERTFQKPGAAKEYGSKGGLKSRRGKIWIGEDENGNGIYKDKV